MSMFALSLRASVTIIIAIVLFFEAIGILHSHHLLSRMQKVLLQTQVNEWHGLLGRQEL